MTYDKQEGDIFYYHVDIDYKSEHVKIRLPRYAPMVGWIEVFGLPPQNEWVVLDSTEKLKKKGVLTIKQKGRAFKINETINITTDSKACWRVIRLERSSGKVFENQLCVEDWSCLQDQRAIKKYLFFEHSKGTYFVTLECIKNPKLNILSVKERRYLDTIQKERGKSNEVWLKKFSANGVPPPLYYKIFPFWKNNWKRGDGRALEIGYEKEMSHGDWYKLFTLGTQHFEIKEDGWGSRRVTCQGKQIRIKDTYRKSIRELRGFQ